MISEEEWFLEDCSDFGIDPASVGTYQYDPDACPSPLSDSNSSEIDDIWDV